MGKKLSERQRKVFTFLEDFIDDNGYPPTVREIMNGIGLTSTSLVTYYLDKLEERGLLKREAAISRGIRLISEPDEDGEVRKSFGWSR